MLETRAARDASVIREWEQAYQAARKAGSTERAARAAATAEAARRARLTPRRVQMILKEERPRIQRQAEVYARALRTIEPKMTLMRRARARLTCEQWSYIQGMPADLALPMLGLIADGAEALEENKKLRARLTVLLGTSTNSTKR
ncbi:MAG: hypothetical protein M0038_05800 [Pseudomonadota bacterium]|jgi:hypothetical protein|nr:hypothetical protein [Pseudomonadota bacterium]